MANRFLQHVRWNGKSCDSCKSSDFESDCITYVIDTVFDVRTVASFQEYFNKINEINNKIADGVYKDVYLSSDESGCYSCSYEVNNVFINADRRETREEAAARLSRENIEKVRLEKETKKKKQGLEEKEKRERALYEKLKTKYGEIK